MVARSLVAGVSGVVRSVSYADGLVSVVVGDTVVRHRVGARAGIPVTASRDLWVALQAAKSSGITVTFLGRPGWDGWFDSIVREITREEWIAAEEDALDLCCLPE